jgi:hypothetical protein
MKLWNIKTGALWEGSPVDARELLTRKGWSKDEPVPIAPPEIETEKLEVSGTITTYFDNQELIEKYIEKPEPEPEADDRTLLQMYGEKPKRKYIRHGDK